ncbi:sugar ABC transporter permease [Deinococcus roseus]|uniref:Xylose transport system permease protein XylH n=1 Tax=Deinococcus roseus TaxID=392414 RepID=A0ABQ2DDJ7_9DEIO|nr:sugar ABC transporter permease [Deinococcus roseus]GGJ53905.1 sugar ABC transporter permease [Deinococcus roseus]
MQRSAEKQTSQSLMSSLQLDGRLVFMVVAIAVVWLGFHLLTDFTFLTARNLWNLAVQTSVVGVMVGGMVLIIVTRNIDLSIGSMLGFAGMVMAVTNTHLPIPDPWNAIVTLLLGLVLGAGLGAAQGYFVAYLGVPSFIITLGGLLIYRSGAWILTSGQTIAPLTDNFQVLGGGLGGSIGGPWTWTLGLFAMLAVLGGDISGYRKRQSRGLAIRPVWAQTVVTLISLLLIAGFTLVMNGYTYPRTDIPRGMPVPVLITILVIGIMTWVVRNTRFGRYVFAFGGNPEAARLAGINTRMLTVQIFALMGVLAGLAGAIQTARLNAGTNSTGTLAELSVIAAAVIGGTSLAGGLGTITGAMLGALLMSSLANGMGLMDLQTAWQNVVQGGVLILAVWMDVIYNRNRPR